jgi:hypothetical protein
MIAKSTDTGFDLDKLYAEVFGGYTKPVSGTTSATTVVTPGQ